MKIIKVENLCKSYGDTEAVKKIRFDVEEGEFIAFLGENGAGKTTTINILSTLLKKTSGSVEINNAVLDKDDDYIRKSIGVVFQKNMLDDFLTVRENIMIRGKLYGLSKDEVNARLAGIAEKTGISGFLGRRYGKLSGGQKRRADIARALINSPRILILDEPTTGLDPATRINVWECVQSLRKEKNMTVFLTTHYMEEAAECDRIIILVKGRIAENDTPQNLKRKYSKDRLIMYPISDNKLEEMLEGEKREYIKEKNRTIIYLNSSMDAIEILSKTKKEIEDFEVIKGSMDQVFMAVIAKKGGAI
ncbi:MAG: ABC transporter ATP-binding protein [Clostridia bacterium]|nr:ABC transporter ATP-binding protein [Clostridia bacterium]